MDVVCDGRMALADASADQLLRQMRPNDVIIVSPIGGQGFLLGRGNQQLGPELVRRVGLGGLLCAATEAKLASLMGRPLLVDTGDTEVDEMLVGHVRCVTGSGRTAVYPVALG